MRILKVSCVLGLCLLLAACKSRGPYSLDEALAAGIPLPIVAPGPDVKARYADLGVEYYYYDGGDTFRLDAFFMDGPAKATRVARLSVCTACTPVGLPDEVLPGEFPLSWSKDGVALICKPSPDIREAVSGEPYQSCLFWMDESLYVYKLYTAWDLQVSALFANTLLDVREPEH